MLSRPGQGPPRGVEAITLAGQLGLPLPVVVTDALDIARKIVANTTAAQQQVGPMPLSIEQLAAENAPELLREMAQRTTLSRLLPAGARLGSGGTAISEACNFAVGAARQHITDAVTEAAPELFAAAAGQWVAVHEVVPGLPEPATSAIDPATRAPEEMAALHQAANVAALARTLRELRGLLARLLGERPMRSDDWSLYYTLPSDPKTALEVIQRLWDKHEGVADLSAPWRAVRAGAKAALCLEAEARARAEALRGERNRQGFEAEQAYRVRNAMTPLGVDRSGQAIMRQFAEAEKQRLVENAAPHH